MQLKDLKDKLGEIDKKVEEYLFNYMVNFYHLLSILDGNGGKTYTASYCNYLLSECCKDVARALIVSEADLDSFSSDINDSYKAMLDNFKDIDIHMLITTFNGESDKRFDVQSKIATLIFICEKKFGTTWEDIVKI